MDGTDVRRFRPAVRAVLAVLVVALIWVVPSDANGSRSPTEAIGFVAVPPGPIPAGLLAGTGVKKGEPNPSDEVVGVASFNVRGPGLLEDRITDVRKLTGDPSVDIIGLQETHDNGGGALMKAAIGPGWTYAQDWSQGNSAEVAVAWRSTRFDLVSARTLRASRSIADLAKVRARRGYSNRDNRLGPARFTAVVMLRDRATGRTVEVINAHTDQYCEVDRGPRAGQPLSNANAQAAEAQIAQIRKYVAESKAHYVVVTGDLNIGFVGDQQARSPRFPRAVLQPVAVPSYASLGLRGLLPSLITSGRFVDYVYLARRSPAVFLHQAVLDGFHSDHRPLVVEVALR